MKTRKKTRMEKLSIKEVKTTWQIRHKNSDNAFTEKWIPLDGEYVKQLKTKAENFDILTKRFNFVNKNGLFSLEEFVDCVLKGVTNWNDKVVSLEGQLEEAQKKAEEKVALLNRMIRQHPESPQVIAWIAMKEYIEKEVLGREVTYEM